MRRSHTIVCALLAAGLGAHAAAAAESWPTRPLTMVVPFAAGGGTDVLGRIVGRRLSEVLGQQVIIENVGGAGGMVGSARVAKAPPDGYTFVLGSRADAINQTLYKNPLYNLATELAPHAEELSPRPRIYADANVPAGLVGFMRRQLQWDVLFVLEEDELRRAPDTKHYRLACQLRRSLAPSAL